MKAETAKHPASESTVIAAINNEPALKKKWQSLSRDQKRSTLERAAGCTESDCLMKAMAENPYHEFIRSKAQFAGDSGFEPSFVPDWLFDFQKHLVNWSTRKGRAAIFADCGLGKTPMQLVWAENVVRKTNGRVLILTPLAVGPQTCREAVKFDIDALHCRDGKFGNAKIVVTNYERLHYFNTDDFVGCVCDESSILKNFDGATKASITEFMRRMQYRLLCTATAAPNDYIELGTSSEALGYLGYMDMLGQFFKNDQNSLHPSSRGRFNDAWYGTQWRFKPHAERDFWKWLCSWARAVRRPSDLGFENDDFQLPTLTSNTHVVNASRPLDGQLFVMPAVGLSEQRRERSHTVKERCEKVASLVPGDDFCVVWGQLNAETDLMEKLIPDAVQVSGRDSDESKEEKFEAFQAGQIKTLITKPVIGAFGLNWQHCNRMTFFPSHSFEQYYQSVRRFWRFGQQRPVTIDLVTTEGESDVMRNLQRKADAADKMFEEIVEEMNNELRIDRSITFNQKVEMPQWM